MARAEETSPSPVCAGLGEDGSSCAQATVGAALLQIQNRVSAEKVNETDEDGQPSGQYFQSSGKCEKVNTYDECAKLAKAIGAPGGDVAGVSRRRKYRQAAISSVTQCRGGAHATTSKCIMHQAMETVLGRGHACVNPSMQQSMTADTARFIRALNNATLGPPVLGRPVVEPTR
eukprot:CAMPEP_0180764388 /NCGR_PEP_ID=MMETSP1038_2-20121128/38429_1 /TAXON_ID=632150 /ORGANISM="Azadinium spinosum, Strain 3D9" /LENGTH=173 /DNA_ID=CAMNT_0022798817 /DNA_START=53 /DNA_END=575 /DNA_ORIENTATION=-